MKWHQTKIPDMNLKHNQDAWRQRLSVSCRSYLKQYIPVLDSIDSQVWENIAFKIEERLT